MVGAENLESNSVDHGYLLQYMGGCQDYGPFFGYPKY